MYIVVAQVGQMKHGIQLIFFSLSLKELKLWTEIGTLVRMNPNCLCLWDNIVWLLNNIYGIFLLQLQFMS